MMFTDVAVNLLAARCLVVVARVVLVFAFAGVV
jgi:hypothetical protein